MSYLEIAQKIKEEIKRELDLSVSIGLAPTKVLSKIASKWRKPDGLTLIDSNLISIESFLKEVSIGKVWGIGRSTSEFLVKKGIKTAFDLYFKDLNWIKENLAKPYEVIWHELHGFMINRVDPNPKIEYSSIQKTRSFHPATTDELFLFSQLSKHIEDTCAKARHFNLITKRVSFFLKSKSFQYFTFSFDLPISTNAPEIIISLSRKFFDKIYNKNILYRTVGVRLYELSSGEIRQNDLFEANTKSNKFELIHKNIDTIENKYGKRVVYLASTHNAIKYKNDKLKGTDTEDLDRDLLFL
jgi:nucleotidyltransferase/DNA polymerase involved in DNA repair